MRKKILPLSMVLITMMLAQIGLVSNAAETQGKYVPRTNSKATISSYMKSVRANQETGLIDPALMLKAQKEAQSTSRTGDWEVMGPDNYGALTRAMVYDENDATGNTFMIGTMGGHIFKSTNGGITMQQAYDLNTMISCMVQKDGVTYIGTGDGRYQYLMNGLSYIGYETSFIGNGIYTEKDGEIELLASTEGWEFVNDMATTENGILAATDDALYYSNNNGESWTTVISGQATVIKTNSAYALAVVSESVYLISFDAEGNLTTPKELTDGENLPTIGEYALKTVALSQSDVNYMYVAFIDYTVGSDNSVTFSTGDIYFSNDGGNEWNVALPATGLYNLFGAYSFTDYAMEVYPNNPRKLLIGGTSFVWVLEDETGLGVYRPNVVSLAGNEITCGDTYVHMGIQNFVFNPQNPNVFFVGTEGGLFKGMYASGEYTFRNCNRYFITEEQHTSVARTFGVGIGGNDDRILVGSIDHGTILIEGDETLNNMSTGRAIFPHWNPESNAAVVNGYSSFLPDYAGGQCAISTIDPNIMFLTTTGSFTTPLFRSESAGDDYDAANFYNADSTFSHAITNANAFRTPFAMYENYNDEAYNEANEIWMTYQASDTIAAGTPIYYHSNIGNYPISGTAPVNLLPGDKCNMYEQLSATIVCGVEGAIYMSKNSHYFNQVSKWWKIGKIEGIPTAVALSEDGDMTIVGTAEGNIYRVSNLGAANTTETAMIDSTAHVIVMDTLDNTLFADRAITGISISGNKVLVSLGNYGNSDYIYMSNDNGNSFTSIQGNLPAMPIYSCLIETSKNTGDLFVGTEHGIYSKRGTNEWVKEGTVNVPVTELKQAIVENHATIADSTVDVVTGEVSYTYYEGVFNEGTIYAATYGNGVLKCNDYRIGGSDLGVAENNATANSFEMSVYPNPVRGTANVKFELSESATVSYQIFDLSGRMVMSNVLGTYAQGENNVSFSTDNLTSGSYIVRLQAGNKTNTSKIMVF